MRERLTAPDCVDENLSPSFHKFDYVTTRAMPLNLIATPIGNPLDITLRALEILKEADVVIGEEHREVSTLLKRLGIHDKRMELLNEHSRDDDVQELLKLCLTLNVALVSDCGTPGFCDPGARLVAACRAQAVSIRPVPGASSLMCLLSMCGQPMNQFRFRGFLPADKVERKVALQELARDQLPVILMDTPYRMARLLSELAEAWPTRRVLIGCDFTQPTELILEGSLSDVAAKLGDRKAEFILALFPQTSAAGARQTSGAAALGAAAAGGASPAGAPKGVATAGAPTGGPKGAPKPTLSRAPSTGRRKFTGKGRSRY